MLGLLVSFRPTWVIKLDPFPNKYRKKGSGGKDGKEGGRERENILTRLASAHKRPETIHSKIRKRQDRDSV